MAFSSRTFNKLLGISAAAVGIYAVILGALTTPRVARLALYAHNVNTLFWHDLNYPLQFGFADGQVTPFEIRTPDGETLYAWHVLPIDVYARHEGQLRTGERHKTPVADFTKTLPFQLLSSTKDPPPRVVINFHGNAGHIAQGLRTETYRALTIHSNTHVLTIDYRGFGHSTGYPTEAGLIADGTTLLNWVMKVANIPPERIVILGQSLGTAVSAAVALNFVDPTSSLTPSLYDDSSIAIPQQVSTPTTFAGVILVAPFSSLASLLLTYRMGGIIPLLAPLRPFPRLAKWIAATPDDKWQTALRLKAYADAVKADPRLLIGTSDDHDVKAQLTREMGAVQIVHAIDDWDITFRETEYICAEVIGSSQDCIDGSNGPALYESKAEGSPRFRFEIVQHGGHNTVITYSPVALAIIRAFEGFPTR